jgi:hypothetical protein
MFCLFGCAMLCQVARLNSCAGMTNAASVGAERLCCCLLLLLLSD